VAGFPFTQKVKGSLERSLLLLRLGCTKRIKKKKNRSCVSHCEAFSFAAFFLSRFLCVKYVKSVFVVRVGMWTPNFPEIFLCFMRMFYARIKRPKIQKNYARIKHKKHKTKKCLRGTCCYFAKATKDKNTRTSHATTNNKMSCAHTTLQRLCPPLFMGRAEAPPNHGTAAPHHHKEAASCRGCARCHWFARLGGFEMRGRNRERRERG
jgi:hypothetical protein